MIKNIGRNFQLKAVFWKAPTTEIPTQETESDECRKPICNEIEKPLIQNLLKKSALQLQMITISKIEVNQI